jgi:hypothetical protein
MRDAQQQTTRRGQRSILHTPAAVPPRSHLTRSLLAGRRQCKEWSRETSGRCDAPQIATRHTRARPARVLTALPSPPRVCSSTSRVHSPTVIAGDLQSSAAATAWSLRSRCSGSRARGCQGRPYGAHHRPRHRHRHHYHRHRHRHCHHHHHHQSHHQRQCRQRPPTAWSLHRHRPRHERLRRATSNRGGHRLRRRPPARAPGTPRRMPPRLPCMLTVHTQQSRRVCDLPAPFRGSTQRHSRACVARVVLLLCCCCCSCWLGATAASTASSTEDAPRAIDVLGMAPWRTRRRQSRRSIESRAQR